MESGKDNKNWCKAKVKSQKYIKGRYYIACMACVLYFGLLVLNDP